MYLIISALLIKWKEITKPREKIKNILSDIKTTVNLNEVTYDELINIPGIGPTLYSKYNCLLWNKIGLYRNIDSHNISGISQKKLSKDHIWNWTNYNIWILFVKAKLSLV